MSTHSTYITLAKTQTYLEDLFKIRIINLEYFDLLREAFISKYTNHFYYV